MRKELLFAMVIYFVTMFILLITVYRILENWQFSGFNFFIAGALVLLVALGWGYVLSSLIFAPQKQMEDTLTALLSDIIHELNIPLSTIQANSAMLKKNLTDEKSLKRIQRIEEASIRLKKLYDELVYGIHKEMHTIEKETFILDDLIAKRLEIFKEQKRNLFIVAVPTYTITVDKIGFEQMFDNLVSNAMKYSPKENPIKVCLEGDILIIEDQGVGMNETELLRIYERYYQADTRGEGEGIGLALVKRYCDDQNIEINFRSEKGVGTTVRLNLEKVHI